MTMQPLATEQTTGPGEPRTMKAITQDVYGRPEVLGLREVEVPVPSDDQVLIRVEASSLNMFDWHMTTGTPYMTRMVAGLRRPKQPVPGADVAGVVELVGRNVTRFAVGDEVFGGVGWGAFAEYTVASERGITHKPDGITFEQAAATSLAGMTALQGLRDVGGLEAGHRVLINGASGGVGTFAVQIAKALGAEVTAVCSTTKVEMVRSIGADKVVDYTWDDYTESEQGYDLLLDNAGNRPWRRTKRVLAPGGINVTITGPKHRWMGPVRNLIARRVASSFSRKRMASFTAAMKQADLETLAGWLEAGEIEPVIERTYPLAEVPEALRYLGEGHALGKVVIEIG